LHGLDYIAVGRHAGASRTRKAAALATRTTKLYRWARGRFDLAVAHGSNDLALAAAWARIPAVNTFDYEFAVQQHNIGCRLAKLVMTPDAIPPERLRRFGVTPAKLRQYPGLKEEYYLADFQPDTTILARLGVDAERVVVIVRPPPDVSLYHRKANPLFPRVLDYLGRRDDVQAVVLPRTDAQRQLVKALDLPAVTVTDDAVDAQSLIAASDLVVSAGGSMNREAVALGVPVYTTYGGRLGGVDEWLLRSGRLRPLTDPRALELTKRDGTLDWPRRDPGTLVDIILSAVG
jgi:predicted glycosyltransferase